VFEHYFTATDKPHWYSFGTITYDAATKHDLRSITKSVTSLILGIAIAKGQIAGIDQPVLPLFPEYADLRSPVKDKITLRHLLTMSQGLKWDEDLPYSDTPTARSRWTKRPTLSATPSPRRWMRRRARCTTTAAVRRRSSRRCCTRPPAKVSTR
jgi:CubicO group peptidase (beta-lactamase class C family)